MVAWPTGVRWTLNSNSFACDYSIYSFVIPEYQLTYYIFWMALQCSLHCIPVKIDALISNKNMTFDNTQCSCFQITRHVSTRSHNFNLSEIITFAKNCNHCTSYLQIRICEKHALINNRHRSRFIRKCRGLAQRMLICNTWETACIKVTTHGG